ncbi:DUF5714 domain-containing protein [Thermoanaerobacterium sp. RBIITD]|uniref:DUF5714 domain-containing protein n=1 Tax=Thermoanaerobacterium sp. RBIITD TaxID=1550240 RepID=UPI000BB6D48A|nr:DUF5714 domain-containing protein [Thermoanaerobacterium sp. RBIITD]SNX54273.1 hypothetical protein SAMN05660242_1925 [Thermoanaerobacterium sp. RBIITD]
MECCEKKYMENCMVCGKPLIYLEKPVLKKCEYCGIEELTRAHCMDGHYVCDSCHAKDGIEVIKEYCLNTKSRDPMEIVENIMADSRIPMHGPEHHALVPAAIVTAYKNLTGKASDDDIIETINRGKEVPGGVCGYYGACGAGVGVGVAISVIYKATPYTPLKRSKAHLAVANALKRIGEAGGARCCKKCTRISIEEAVKFFEMEFDIRFPKGFKRENKCNYSKINRECYIGCKYRNKKGM